MGDDQSFLAFLKRFDAEISIEDLLLLRELYLSRADLIDAWIELRANLLPVLVVAPKGRAWPAGN